MKNKRFIKCCLSMIALVTACLLVIMFSDSKDAYAANGDYVYNGIDYSSVFDYDYYYKMYGDLQKAYGHDKTALFNHFIKYGMQEGRIGRQCFDVKYYKNKYGDLQKAYGNDLTKYYLHYIKYGKKEGRTGASSTVYLKTDYALVFDVNYYYKNNADLQKAYGFDKEKLIAHFVKYGMQEGRKGCATFDAKYYKYIYADLQKAYGNNMSSYYQHYMKYGYKEKRKGYSNSFYKGVDYSAVYNIDYYYNNYKDLQKAYGYDPDKLINHFIKYGMSEGRQASLEFSLSYYKSRYGDLKNAYGDNLKSYYQHYMKYGKKEGRKANDKANYKGWNVVDGKKIYYLNGELLKGWQTIGNRKYYFSSTGILQSQVGIDVSSYQGLIDWEKVKNDGIEFAIIRIGYGSDVKKDNNGDGIYDQDDIYAEINMSECERLGIPYGVYLYSYALSDSDLNSEINHTLRLLKGHNPTIGVFFDYENDSYKDKYGLPSTEAITRFAVNFNEAMKKNGYKSGTYTYNYFWDTQLYSPLLNKYPKWLADYTKGFYPADDTYFIWQYTSSGSVTGISGNVDMNVYIPSWR
ncbi:MAG: glycoside hydrolase family 25 protein [Lachnospiraceae bacterium]|nr:glycoside hydrolase family 25 protein [Lachnospiraceae bacterium]